MLFLPKANVLYENIDAAKVNMPDTLDKLGKGGFTGYLDYISGSGDHACCVFAKGRFICAVFSCENQDRNGFDAISALFDSILAKGGRLNTYRMTDDLAMCAHALLLGNRLMENEEVRHVEIKSLLTRIKAQAMNGAVCFHTSSRYAIMFYKAGQPIGFYHDDAKTIETSPEESRKIAALEGAKLIVLSTRPLDELIQYDLLQMVNMDKLWEAAKMRNSAGISAGRSHSAVNASEQINYNNNLSSLVDDLQEVATAYLSKDGRLLVKRLLDDAGGDLILLDNTKTGKWLDALGKEAIAIDSHAKIDEMIELMRSEIAGRLAV